MMAFDMTSDSGMSGGKGSRCQPSRQNTEFAYCFNSITTLSWASSVSKKDIHIPEGSEVLELKQ